MLSISETNQYQPIVIEFKKTKHKFEYQEICEELEPIYGKQIWLAPSKIYFTEYKLKKAHEICKQRNILTFSYLLGVMKNL